MQKPGLLLLPLLLALRRPLIVLELALGKRDLDLDAALQEVQVERYQRVAALLDLADQAPDLFRVHEQLAGAHRVRGDMGRCAAERADMRPEQPEGALVDDHIGIADLRASRADRLDLPAFEHEPRLIAILDEII